MPEKCHSLLVSLEGIDGAGKTTLSTEVVDRLRAVNVALQSHREIAQTPAFAKDSMETVATLLWPEDDTTFDHLLPPEYWLYLQATWYTLLSSFVIGPKLEAGGHILTGGWYFKFFCKLRLRGFSNEFLASIFRHVRQPDIVVLIDVDVPQVWERGGPFRAAEMGLHHGYAELGRSSFVDYQTRLQEEMRSACARLGWLRAPLDAVASPGANADAIAELLRPRLSR